MMCPRCGTGLTDVLATRKYRGVLPKRTRRCYNNHTFTTYEVTAGCIDRRQLDAAVRGAEQRAEAARVRAAVLRDDRPASVVAAAVGRTEARVRQIRAGAAPGCAPCGLTLELRRRPEAKP
jgi:transcriptional regulator NrdR family protein